MKNKKINRKKKIVFFKKYGLYIASVFIACSFVLFRYGYRVSSLVSFVAGVGFLIGSVPIDVAVFTSFLSISISLLSTFFDALDYQLNRKTLV